MHTIIGPDRLATDLADAIVARTHEVYAYDLNIANYSAIVNSGTGVWPERLQHLRGLGAADSAQKCSFEDLDDLAELQQYDRAEFLLKTETLERAKANGMLSNLHIQLDNICTPEEKDLHIIAASQRWNSATSGGTA